MTDRLKLAGDHLVNILSPEHNYLPFYECHINDKMEVFTWLRGASHNTGRWVDAMLRLEDATGYAIPKDIEAAVIANLKVMYDNPDHLFLNPLPEDSPFPPQVTEGQLEYHSMREGLLALTQMIRYRDSDWAKDKAKNMIDTVDRISDTGIDHWKCELLDRWQRMGQPGKPISRTVLDSGRFMEAGMDYVMATENEQALQLVKRFAEIHYEYNTWPGGTRELYWANNHTHSYYNTLKGMLLYGAVSGEKKYVDRVAETYATTLQNGTIKESGITFHDCDKETGGDPAAAGDAMQIALWLSHNGYPEYLDDVERIVRSRLLASQLTECPPLSRYELPLDEEGKPYFINQVSKAPRQVKEESVFYPENINEIVLGAWGIFQEAHWAKQPTTDVSAAVLHSLCDFYTNITEDQDSERRIIFLVDYEDDRIKISTSESKQATVKIENKDAKDLSIRIPDWVPTEGLSVKVDDQSIDTDLVNSHLTVKSPNSVELVYDLPEKITEEITNGVTYKFRWKGDRITGITPNSDWLPFYPNF